ADGLRRQPGVDLDRQGDRAEPDPREDDGHVGIPSVDGGPGMGVTFTWRPTAKAARNGQGGDPAGHDTERCEYQFKYNKSQAGDYKVWVPAPERYEICDTLD